VTLAAASDAVLIGFNVRPDAKSEDIARKEDVEVKTTALFMKPSRTFAPHGRAA